MRRGAIRLLAAAALLATAAAGADVAGIAPQALAQDLRAGERPLLLDVRTPEEFAAGHLPGALNIPLQELPQRAAELPGDGDIVVYCESGRRAKLATQALHDAGFKHLRELQGSMRAWREAELPVEVPAR